MARPGAGQSAGTSAFLQGRGIGKAIEIASPAFLRRVELVIPEEKIQESFSQAGKFFESAPMPRIGDRQAQKLQCSEEGQSAVFGVVLVEPIEGPFDFAPDIGQLFHQGKSLPAAGRQ